MPSQHAGSRSEPGHRRVPGLFGALRFRTSGRHTAATLLLSEGVHPRVVVEVLGHAQMRTTTDTYSHVMPALGRDAADRMGRALWD
jgi:integrase